jgi:uncharacterized protein (TIGR02284 family)
MTQTNVSLLQTLGDTMYDSVEGYRQAADKTDSPPLQNYFRARSDERAAMLQRINIELEKLGGKPVTGGTVTGAAHRAFLNIADALSDGDEAVIERVDEGEEYLTRKFEEALKHGDLDASARTMIETSLRELRESEAIAGLLERTT